MVKWVKVTRGNPRAISAVLDRGTLMKRSIFLWFALVSQPVPAVAGWLARRTDGQGKLDLDIGHRRGDPSRDFKFWVYPSKLKLVNRQWDTHEHPRDYCTKYRVDQRLKNVCRASHVCAGLCRAPANPDLTLVCTCGRACSNASALTASPTRRSCMLLPLDLQQSGWPVLQQSGWPKHSNRSITFGDAGQRDRWLGGQLWQLVSESPA